MSDGQDKQLWTHNLQVKKSNMSDGQGEQLWTLNLQVKNRFCQFFYLKGVDNIILFLCHKCRASCLKDQRCS